MGINGDGVLPDGLPEWYQAILGDLDFPLGWPQARNKGLSIEEWAEEGRRTWIECLFPEPGLDLRSMPQGNLEYEEDRRTYLFQEWRLSLGPHRWTKGWVSLPKGLGPFPGALVLHDHGARFDLGKEKMARPSLADPRFLSAQQWVADNYGGRWVAEELAKRGWASLTIDALGWGDRTLENYENQQALGSNLLNLGTSWAGIIALEDIASAKWLGNQPWIDPKRVVALGHSMGGFRASQVTSLSPDIQSGVAVCFQNTLQHSMGPGTNRVRGQSAFSTTHPGLFRYLDFSHMTALGAPKPLLLIHGEQDKLFPVDALDAAVGIISQVYRDWGVEDRLTTRLRPGGHCFSLEDQTFAWEWLETR